VLEFYRKVLGFQKDLSAEKLSRFDPEQPLREQIDLSLALENLPTLFAITVESAPDLLAIKAKALQSASQDEWQYLLQAALLSTDPAADDTVSFFARACLQPLAEGLQAQLPDVPDYFQNTCPACGGHPQAAILRPEGDGGRRSLLCSFCLREWLFRRVVCPWCGEEDKQKLPSYSDQTSKFVRLHACDTCHCYLKAVDMTIDGNAVPLVDEVALAVLDVWATDHGYTKIVRNLLGF